MIKALRGTVDILPPETALWARAEACARELCERYGYSEIRTPVFERTELFVRSIGDTTDIVEKEMYTFADRKERSITLRPEGTACVVRACLEHKLFGQGKLHKFYYLGPMFRYERPQAGRQRQFHQIGVEIFGTYSPLADAESIAVLVRYFELMGLTGISVNLNSIGDAESRAAYSTMLRDFVTPLRDKLCPDCQRRMERNILRVLDCKVPSCKELFAGGAPRMTEALSDSARAHYECVQAALDRLGIAYREEPKLVRGLDYYTHTIFEVTHATLGAQDALGGGGRYDGLVEEMGGPPTGAVGWALGCERMIIALQAAQQGEPSPAVDVCMVAFDEEALQENAVYADKLRNAGLRVACGYDQQSVKSQMRQANASGAAWVVMRGGDERSQGTVKLKNMHSGEEEFVKADGLVETLRQRIHPS